MANLICVGGVVKRMQVTFCGGAGEVGASCILVQIDGKNIVLDSGIRMKGSDPLPSFRRIQELGGVDVFFASHAHLDHTGSLPVISREYPAARIYMTHATKALTKVLLYDSLKIMDRSEADIPLYAEKHVLAMLDQIVCYSPQFSFKILPDCDVTATFYPAGHIAGASMIYLQGKEGSLLYTGDFAAGDQLTVTGAVVPKLRPDVLIMESTYGENLHSSRQIEERRLVEAVNQVYSQGGKVLFPAFALGRAQELILILRRAMVKKQLPKFPIYIDGMVRQINRVYQDFPNYLRPDQAKKALRGRDLFYNDEILPVTTKDIRSEILEKNSPLCVISSSGMLKGGPSMLYAEKFASDPRNLIGITGYQDEESPGREVLNMLAAPSAERMMKFDDKQVTVQCQLERFGLSAHADRGELLGLVERVGARRIFLVHGEITETQAFGALLQSETRGEVYVPENGDEYQVEIGKPRKQHRALLDIPVLGRDIADLHEDSLPELWQHVYDASGVERFFTCEDLLYIWSGCTNCSEEMVQRAVGLFNESALFLPNTRRLFLYHPAPPEVMKKLSGPMEVNEMIALIKSLTPPEAGLYKVGARLDEHVALLSFHFPKMAQERYGHLFKTIVKQTGWQVEINKNCHIGAAEELVRSRLPGEVSLTKFSAHEQLGYFQVAVDEKVDGADEIRVWFRNQTGLDLRFTFPGQKPETASDFEVLPPHGMNQNEALQYVEDTLTSLGAKHFRKGCKKQAGIPYIEVSFISPQVAKGYAEHLRALEQDTGWSIIAGQNPNQHAIIQIAKELCRSHGLEIRKNPSIYPAQGMVSLQITSSTNPEVIEAIGAEFSIQTGFSLEMLT